MLVIKVSRDENAPLFVLLRILSVAYGDAINYTISVFTLDSYSRCIWVEGGECICTYIIELTRVLIRRDCSRSSFNNLHHEGTVSLQDCNTYIVITSCTGSLNLGPI